MSDQKETESIRKVAKRHIFIALIWIGAGLLITLGTYSSVSKNGGTYIITYGPIIYGIFKLLRALRIHNDGKIPAQKQVNVPKSSVIHGKEFKSKD
ncbi:MAG: hypothetical protein JWM44_4224 [Bacilli bacterium]|nr:hypothetical protein [Bacilli bacterium]